MIVIRELGPEDWRTWRQVRLAALRDAPDMFGSTHTEWENAEESRWRARLTDVPLHALAELDGVAAGVVSVTGSTDGVLELISMWVAPSARGRGVGDALIEYAVAWARQRDPRCAVVLNVRTHNWPAIALYARHGFIESGPNPQDELEIVMRRAVGPSA